MSILANYRAYEIAGKLGALLEQEQTRDVGVALGMVLGQFILLLERSDEGISDGIDAVAGDAKDVARKLRNMRQ